VMQVEVVLALISVCSAYFSVDFTRWLDKHHGIGARQRIERSDLAGKGSFGGREHANQTLSRNPVVFVQGVSNVAGRMMMEAAKHYRKNGSTFAELYATTYDNPHGDPLRWMQYRMKCDHIKRVRFLIEAVHQYTGRRVDVVSFSMGVPISRKAILGGRCVDNNDDLGGRISKQMGSFVGVAGPNKGVAPVIMGLPYALCAMSPMIPVCNPIDGFFSGFCPFKSRFVDDINRRQHYEGQRVFSIGSMADEVVGHFLCGEVTTRIGAQDGEKIFTSRKHDETFVTSYDTQLAMLGGRAF
ncbi:hypothetical protein PMAYCL1PPCAC_32208, partial [Pristionchus mayeri]